MNATEVRKLFGEWLENEWTDAQMIARAALEVAAQVAELNQNLRDIHPELNMPEECRQHKCSYYTHYLAYGGPDLTHEGFHGAEENCRVWQERAQKWMDDHKDDSAEMPKHLEDACRRAEERVRA